MRDRYTAGSGTARTAPGGCVISRGALLRLAATGVAAVALRGSAARAGGSLRVRRNARTLTAEEWGRFVRAVHAMKDLPSLYDPSINAYDYYVRLHLGAYYDETMPAHMAAAFLPWHRQLVLMVEQDLRRTEPDVTIPYWDWTVDGGRDSYLWTDAFMGGEGDPADRWIVKTGPFRQGMWRLAFIDPASLDQDGTIFDLQRHFGVYVSGGEVQTTLPTAADVEAALAIPVYDVAPWDDMSDSARSFRNNLEGFRRRPDGSRLPAENHNRVHNWVGGAMSEGASPNDPVFWLHHSFIDLLWAEWQRRHGAVYLPASGARLGQNLRDPLWMLGGATAAMVLDHHALGYRYDRESA